MARGVLEQGDELADYGTADLRCAMKAKRACPRHRRSVQLASGVVDPHIVQDRAERGEQGHGGRVELRADPGDGVEGGAVEVVVVYGNGRRRGLRGLRGLQKLVAHGVDLDGHLRHLVLEGLELHADVCLFHFDFVETLPVALVQWADENGEVGLELAAELVVLRGLLLRERRKLVVLDAGEVGEHGGDVKMCFARLGMSKRRRIRCRWR